MTIIESDFPDGMEYDGLFFLNQSYFTYYSGTPSSGLCALSAHETAHQWWYRVVSNNQALEPWMDEALCTYSELLFYEYYHPELVDWWWQYRIDDFNPGGWVDSTIYTTSDYRPYVNAVYLRGVRFLDGLRAEIGKEALLNALHQYAEAFQNNSASSLDLLQKLGPSPDLLQQYFSSPPSLE
jgi:aminopeptidase N